MGAADAVPGVSGGTIAFISGIYEELIHSIRSCDLGAVKVLLQSGPVAFWKHINGNFLLTLLSGILLSVLTLARIVLYLLENEPVLIWSFFFGLILASTWSVVKHVGRWSGNRIAGFALGSISAYLITTLSPGAMDVTPLVVFLSGMIAICAMILPGISGSFILLLLGMYSVILGAVKELDLAVLSLFMVGCAAGLLSFSRLLSWAFSHFRAMTLAVLGGFLLGSLNKVWPWKYTLAYSLNSKGEQVPLVQQNLLPSLYQEMTGIDSQWIYALGLCILGMLIVLLLERKAD